MIDRFHTCDKDCYGACVFKGTWDDEKKVMLAASPLKDHPFTRGFFCGKYMNRVGLLYHLGRLKMPLLRSGPKGTNQFEKIGVDEAWLQIAAKARDVVKNYGPKAILGAFYSGNTGLLAGSYPVRFFAKLGGTVTGGGICNEGGIEGLKQLFGTYSTTNPFQLQNIKTRLIVIWGSDLASHNIHAAKMVENAQEHGAKLAVIDTRRTATASSADLFIHATPGTEGMIALLVLKRLMKDEQIDNAFLGRHVGKVDDVIDLIRGLDEDAVLSAININKNENDQSDHFDRERSKCNGLSRKHRRMSTTCYKNRK